MSRQSTPRSWIAGLLGSFLFHVVLLLALILGGLGWLNWKAADDASPGTPAAVASKTEPASPDVGSLGSSGEDLAATDPAAFQQMLATQAAEADSLSDQERLARIQSQTAWLDGRDPARVGRMAEQVSRFVAGGRSIQRAMAPHADAEGAFDPESATVYDIVERRESDGRTVYDWTLVDAAGRTLVAVYEADQMTAQDRAAARVFAMAREHPNLRTLVDAARTIVASRPEADSARDAVARD